MRTLVRGAIIGSCCWAASAIGATLPPVPVSVHPGNQLSFQGFDPALGTLRCVRVELGLVYDVVGDMFVVNFTTSVGTATICVGATCGIGHTDGTGFVAHAGAGSCVEITNTCTGTGSNCLFPVSVSGGTSATVLVTSGGYLIGYIGAGLRGLQGGAAYSQQGVSATPGCFTGMFVDSFMATPTFGLSYIYTPINRCPGDVNSDGAINFLDLNDVLSSWTETGPCARGDVNNDSVVDFVDLNEVLGYWGAACPD